jgi:hypothetical protein
MLLTMAMLLGVAGSGFAQQPAPTTNVGSNPFDELRAGGCWPVTSRDRVIVQMDTGPARTGTLLCMGPEEIMLTGSGMLPLSSIRQITKPRDSYLDGVLKGAAVGLVILVFCAPECPGEYLMRATLGYAMIGGVIDGLQGNNETIYQREPKVALTWKVRF